MTSFVDGQPDIISLVLRALRANTRHHAPCEWAWHISTNYKWRQWYWFGVSQLVFGKVMDLVEDLYTDACSCVYADGVVRLGCSTR